MWNHRFITTDLTLSAPLQTAFMKFCYAPVDTHLSKYKLHQRHLFQLTMEKKILLKKAFFGLWALCKQANMIKTSAVIW